MRWCNNGSGPTTGITCMPGLTNSKGRRLPIGSKLRGPSSPSSMASSMLKSSTPSLASIGLPQRLCPRNRRSHPLRPRLPLFSHPPTNPMMMLRCLRRPPRRLDTPYSSRAMCTGAGSAASGRTTRRPGLAAFALVPRDWAEDQGISEPDWTGSGPVGILIVRTPPFYRLPVPGSQAARELHPAPSQEST